MKKRTRITLGALVLVYATGVAVAMTVFLSQSRYDCYAKRGYIGIFWCPEVVNEVRWGLLTAKSAIWPYYIQEYLSSLAFHGGR